MNCSFSTLFQGIYGYQINGFTADGCSFENIGHNSIALQNYSYGEPQYTKGKISITDNSFSNSDTPIGRGGFKDADILISGNDFADIKDEAIVKFGAGDSNANQKLYDVTVDFTNNRYGSKALPESDISTGTEKNSIVITNTGEVTVS